MRPVGVVDEVLVVGVDGPAAVIVPASAGCVQVDQFVGHHGQDPGRRIGAMGLVWGVIIHTLIISKPRTNVTVFSPSTVSVSPQHA